MITKIYSAKTIWHVALLVTGIFVLLLNIFFQVSIYPEDAHAQVKAAATIDICVAEGDLTLNEGDVPNYAGDDIVIDGCTFTINGAHSFASLTIGDGAGGGASVLTHTPSNTTTVYKMDLTISGAMTINNNGSINLVAKGFERKYTTDGAGGTQLRTGVSTDIYGGGHGGEGGGIGTTIPAYDSITEPTEPGAGGDGGNVGYGHGGGYLKLSTVNFTNNGSINANGQEGLNFTGGGAGGGLWIITTGTVSGSGTISADGGNYSGAYATSRGTGAGGRIAFYHNNSAPSSMTISAIAGNSTESSMWGGAGTIYVQDNSLVPGTYANGEGNLTIANDDTTITPRQTPISGNFEDFTVSGGAYAVHTGSSNLNTLTVQNYGYLNGATYVVTGAVTLTNNAILSHLPSTTTTVYKLDIASGSFSVDATSQVNLVSKGFEQEYTTDGAGGTQFRVGTSTDYYGGGHGGEGGGIGTTIPAYGSITQPVEPGAGGDSGGTDAGHGGGALKLSTGNFTLNGAINVSGGAGSNFGGGGAGGSAWITSTGTVSGSGTISSNGGDYSGAYATSRGTGAGGRIAFYHDNSAPSSMTFEAYAGNSTTASMWGGAGTIYLQDNSLVPGTYADGEGELTIANDDTTTTTRQTPFSGNLQSLDVGGGALAVSNSITAYTIANDVTVTNYGVLSHTASTTSQAYVLDITADTITVGATGEINVDSRGYPAEYTADGVGEPTQTGASLGKCGGAHGGYGGQGDFLTCQRGDVYDNLFEPVHPGGGGGTFGGASYGGGAVKLDVDTLVLNGLISANGQAGAGPGGAGGSVWIITATSFTGSGSISANGADSGFSNRGSGGGGRVAIEYPSTFTFSTANISSESGTNTATTSGARNGGAGTIYLEGPSDTNEQGDLIIDDSSNNVTAYPAPLIYTGGPSSLILENLSIINNGRASLDQPPCTTGLVLTVNGEIDLSNGGLLVDNSSGNCTTSLAALNITPTTLIEGVINIAYSQSVSSAGGYAPKTYQCLDGLGGSVVTCDNANAGLPNGLTMSSAGLVSGTPIATGTFNFVVRVTDSDPGGAVTDEETISITIGNPPNEPVRISPTDGGTVNVLTPELEATYSDSDAGDTGTVEFRVSSGSQADCINNVSVVASGSSAVSASNTENLTYTVSPNLTDLTTYNWCARNNDGVAASNSGAYTAMGEFTVDLSYVPGGSSPQKQQSVNQQQTINEPTDSTPSEDSFQEQLEEEVPQQENPTDETAEPDMPPVEEPVVEQPEPEIPVESIPEDPQPVDSPELPRQEQDEAPGDNLPPPPPEQPTQQELNNVDRILDQLIQQEVIDNGGDNGRSTPSTGPETNSQSDGRSFSIEVEEDQEQLFVTGLAQTDQDRIEFTGTTSEPGATVTLVFNNSITVVVTSDANGFWQTFVNADQLGVDPGQRANISIEAIAAKNGLRSDKVAVGAVELDVSSTNGEVVAEFESIFSESQVVSDIRSVTRRVEQIITEQEEVIQQTLTVSAPIVVVASAPLWGYLPYAPTLVYHFITYLVGLVGRRKQEDQSVFGTVYDAITKKPLGLVVLRIYKQLASGKEQLIATKVTDKSGRYDLLLEPGNYRIEAKKPQYTFPSKIESFNPVITITAEVASTPDIPIDPVNAQKQFSAANVLKKLWLSFQKAGHFLALPILFIGALAGVATVASVPESPENWILACCYILMFLLQLRLRPAIEKAWGVVYDLANNAVLPLTTIQLIDPEYGKVVKSRLTDYEGRFAFLPEPGNYIVKANKPGYEQAEVIESPDKEHNPISGEVSVQKEGERISGDVAMRSI